jgi:hypothetical protein
MGKHFGSMLSASAVVLCLASKTVSIASKHPQMLVVLWLQPAESGELCQPAAVNLEELSFNQLSINPRLPSILALLI